MMWPLVTELHQGGLISSEESERLSENFDDVVRIQICKSLEVVIKTADVLRRYGLEKESKVLSGKSDIVLVLLPCAVLYSAVEQTCYGKFESLNYNASGESESYAHWISVILFTLCCMTLCKLCSFR